MKNNNYTISDTNKGVFAKVELDGKEYNLSLRYRTGSNNRRTWEVCGKYPTEKYLISYEGGKLIILEKGGEYEVGQTVNHKAFGKGIVTNVTDTTLAIDFGAKGEKCIMKSILNNFLV